jgi:hypothetical protein
LAAQEATVVRAITVEAQLVSECQPLYSFIQSSFAFSYPSLLASFNLPADES